MSGLKSKSSTDGNVNVSTKSGLKAGYAVGLTSEINLPLLFVKPELYYSHSSGEIEVNNISETINLNRLDLPVIVGLKFGLIRVGVGPVLSYSIDDSYKFTASEIDFKHEYERLSAGYQIMLGTNLGTFVAVDIRYEDHLSDSGVLKGSNLAGISLDNRPHSFMLNLNIFLK